MELVRAVARADPDALRQETVPYARVKMPHGVKPFRLQQGGLEPNPHVLEANPSEGKARWRLAQTVREESERRHATLAAPQLAVGEHGLGDEVVRERHIALYGLIEEGQQLK